MSSLEVTFVTPESAVWHGQAAQVVVPAQDGSMGILPRMQPVLATLGEGDVRIISEGGEVQAFRIDGGFISMDQDVLTIAVDRLDAEIGRSGADQSGDAEASHPGR